MTAEPMAAAGGSAPSSRLFPKDLITAAIVLLLVALAVRLLFFVGYQGRDDRNYLSYALYVVSGHPIGSLDVQTQWVGRIGFWLPLAASIRLFGANQAGYVLIPLAFSLAGVLVTLALGAMTVGRRATLLAAALLTVFPLDVLYATRAYPDLPLGVMLTLAYWLTLRTRTAPRSIGLPIAAGLALGAAYLQKETALFALLPIGVALRFWKTTYWRALIVMGGAVALVVAAELTFWSVVKHDPLYRFHAADSALERVLEQSAAKAQPHSWIPGPKPSEIYRSTNSILDAALMLGMNEEFGIFYWLLIPLLVFATMKSDAATRDLRLWILLLLPLILFFPVHWPRFTMPRDPRYLTCLTIPGLLILSSYVLRARPLVQGIVLTAVVGSSLAGAYVGKESSRMEPAASLVARLSPGGQRMWVTPQLAADLLIMTGMNPQVPVGVHFLEQGKSSASYQAAMLIRPDLPVAETAADLPDGTLVLRGRDKAAVAPPAGWTLSETIEPAPPAGIRAAQRLLRMVRLSSFARKLAPGGGVTALLYRKGL